MLARLAVCLVLPALAATHALAQEAPAPAQTPVATLAEPLAEMPATVTRMTLPSADGSRMLEYAVSDFAVSVSRSISYGVGDPRGEVSASLNLAAAPDDALLQWASQAAADSAQPRDVVVRSDNPGAPKVYEMRGARVLGLNISGGSMNMISLQLGLSGLTIDGVPMN